MRAGYRIDEDNDAAMALLHALEYLQDRANADADEQLIGDFEAYRIIEDVLYSSGRIEGEE